MDYSEVILDDDDDDVFRSYKEDRTHDVQSIGLSEAWADALRRDNNICRSLGHLSQKAPTSSCHQLNLLCT